LQFEAVWALTNVLSGSPEDTQHVISLGCIEKILKLIECNESCADLVDQCVWALGNISADSAGSRDLVLSHGTLSIILPFFKTNNPTNQRLSFLRNATWVLANMMGGQPSVSIEYVKDVFPILIDLIQNQTDEQVLTDACWALSHTLDRPHISNVIESGLLEALPQLLNHSNQVLRKEAVWILSSIAAGTVSQVQKAIDAGLVQQAFDILNNS
ncbi:predicted protein, partial [Naegleria gruberi]